MDWTAQILGLDKSFYNTTEVGGGVIQVCLSFPSPVTESY
jgi:aromatic-L-amino-acid decarboxylase